MAWLTLRCNSNSVGTVSLTWMLSFLMGALLCWQPTARAQEESPPDPETLYWSGKYEDCAELAADRLEDRPLNQSLWMLLIRSQMERGQYAEAQASLEQALGHFPISLPLRWLGREVYRFNGKPEQADLMDVQFAELVQRAPWQFGDAQSQLVIGHFFLEHGADPKKVQDNIYTLLKRRQPAFVEVVLASGELALSKQDFALAARHFEEALKLKPDRPDVHFGLARAYAETPGERSQKAIEKTLELNPDYIPALLMLVENHIDAERYELAAVGLNQIEMINPDHPLAAACRSILAHLKNDAEAERLAREKALSTWKENPQVDHLIGLKLSRKYRFAEAAEAQRRALELDPEYQPARLQLAQDLLRLGQEEEGWKLAREVSQKDGYNVVAHNLVILEESLARFATLERDGLLVRMDAREAEIYGQNVLDLLVRARADLLERYPVQLPEPVIVEIFPKQSDFAIRTFGLPGGDGFLGVCFGTVITANSPASQAGRPSCWEATLWHEFCHVVTLNKTRNRMPRWLSEGISVYEEQRQNPAWGQAMTPQYRQMLLADDLTPLSQLSSAFLQARSAAHLQFAYFESALAVEYLVERAGQEALGKILDDLAEGLLINDALQRHCGDLESLDSGFRTFARARAEQMGPGADWSTPDLPPNSDLVTVKEWVSSHPTNYEGLSRLARLQWEGRDADGAIATLEKMRSLHPDDLRSVGPDARLAAIYQQLERPDDERTVLKRWVSRTPDQPDSFLRLAELSSKIGDWETCRDMVKRGLAVNPLQTSVYRTGLRAAQEVGDRELAVRCLRAMLLLDPIDPSGLHLELATLLEEEGDLNLARRHAVLALEETPRYQLAHERLRSIANRQKVQPAVTPADSETASPPPPPVSVLLEGVPQ